MNVLKEIKENDIKICDIDALYIFVGGKEIKYDRLKDSVKELKEKLNGEEYDNDFGTQKLFGLILMKDNSWFERAEYDGSEWWEYKKQITRENVFNFKWNE